MVRPRRARTVVSLTVLLVGALWVLVPALPASAATSLTVTPNTGLTGGTVVTVAGTGWAPNALLGYCQAVPVEPVGPNDCDGGSTALTYADSSGNFSFGLRILRLIRPPAVGALVDCADPATPCVIGVGDVAHRTGSVVTVTLAFTTPPPPTLVPGSASTVEGNSGNSTVDFPIGVINGALQTITVDWRTVFVPGAPGNQADPATDYTPASGTLTIAPGDTFGNVTILVNGDTLVEPDEYIVVQFGNPTNARIGGFYGLGFATIVNDDHAVVLPGVGAVDEGNSGTTNLDVPVTLTNPSTQTITAQWTTAFAPGLPGNPADPASDYTAAAGTVTFPPGETTETVTIRVNGDTLVEPDEYILLLFGNVTNAKIGGFYGLGFGGIVNDD
jgi:Neocarzinostatin family/Calx-beta domain